MAFSLTALETTSLVCCSITLLCTIFTCWTQLRDGRRQFGLAIFVLWLGVSAVLTILDTALLDPAIVLSQDLVCNGALTSSPVQNSPLLIITHILSNPPVHAETAITLLTTLARQTTLSAPVKSYFFHSIVSAHIHPFIWPSACIALLQWTWHIYRSLGCALGLDATRSSSPVAFLQTSSRMSRARSQCYVLFQNLGLSVFIPIALIVASLFVPTVDRVYIVLDGRGFTRRAALISMEGSLFDWWLAIGLETISTMLCIIGLVLTAYTMHRFQYQFKKHAPDSDQYDEGLSNQVHMNDDQPRTLYRSRGIINRLLTLCLALNITLGATRIVRLVYDLQVPTSSPRPTPNFAVSTLLFFVVALMNSLSSPFRIVDVDLYLTWVATLSSLVIAITLFLAMPCTRMSRSWWTVWRWCSCDSYCFGYGTTSTSPKKELLEIQCTGEERDQQQRQHQRKKGQQECAASSNSDSYVSSWPKSDDIEDMFGAQFRITRRGSRLTTAMTEEHVLGAVFPESHKTSSERVRQLNDERHMQQVDFESTYSFLSLNAPSIATHRTICARSTATSAVSTKGDINYEKVTARPNSTTCDNIPYPFPNGSPTSPLLDDGRSGLPINITTHATSGSDKKRSSAYDSSWLPAKPVHAQLLQRSPSSTPLYDRYRDPRILRPHSLLIRSRSTFEFSHQDWPPSLRSPLDGLLLRDTDDARDNRGIAHSRRMAPRRSLYSLSSRQAGGVGVSTLSDNLDISQGRCEFEDSDDQQFFRMRSTPSKLESSLSLSSSTAPLSWSFQRATGLESSHADTSSVDEGESKARPRHFMVSKMRPDEHSTSLAAVVVDMQDDQQPPPDSPRLMSQRISLVRYSSASSSSIHTEQDQDKVVEEEEPKPQLNWSQDTDEECSQSPCATSDFPACDNLLPGNMSTMSAPAAHANVSEASVLW